MIEHIEETTSTNDDARREKYREGDIVWAERQSAGRGQRGHTWTSPEGENLTFSLVLEPRFLPVSDQFMLLEIIALSLCDTFDRFGIATRIKWTNDIYWNDRKLVGILIEHNYSGDSLSRTIVGVGINVNQTVFDPALPNPVSMRQITGQTYDREQVLRTFHEAVMARYGRLQRGERDAVCEDYHRRMYRLDEFHTFREQPSAREIRAAVRGVLPTGELLLERQDGTRRAYLFREVEFVI